MSIRHSPDPMPLRILVLAAIAAASLLVASCAPENRVASSPQDLQDETARQQAGIDSASIVKLDIDDATYVGEKVCLGCHENAGEHYGMGVHGKAFRSNPRSSVQKEVCEACHGPGSKHAKESLNRSYLIGYTKSWGTPVERQNAQCLGCHQGAQRIYWQGSTHQVNNIACSDCHNPMTRQSVTGSLQRPSISQTCFTCHPQQRAEFHKRSHMPLPEGKMSCEDCHNPHGSPTKPLLKADSINELCYTCHAEKRGPFLWEHAPVRESCANCHLPHGSNNDKLLIVPRPWLCQQCHDPSVGHPGLFYNASQTAEVNTAVPFPNQPIPSQRIIGRACQNCHTQIHGSNHPAGARWQR